MEFGAFNLNKITLEYWVDFIKQKKFDLKMELSKGKSISLKINKKKYSLSTFQYLTRHLILMTISDPFYFIFIFCVFSKDYFLSIPSF